MLKEQQWPLFDELVHSKNIDDHAKLSRLLQFCTGVAYNSIKNCVLIDDGYQVARNTLKSRFGDKILISQKILTDFEKF